MTDFTAKTSKANSRAQTGKLIRGIQSARW